MVTSAACRIVVIRPIYSIVSFQLLSMELVVRVVLIVDMVVLLLLTTSNIFPTTITTYTAYT